MPVCGVTAARPSPSCASASFVFPLVTLSATERRVLVVDSEIHQILNLREDCFVSSSLVPLWPHSIQEQNLEAAKGAKAGRAGDSWQLVPAVCAAKPGCLTGSCISAVTVSRVAQQTSYPGLCFQWNPVNGRSCFSCKQQLELLCHTQWWYALTPSQDIPTISSWHVPACQEEWTKRTGG